MKAKGSRLTVTTGAGTPAALNRLPEQARCLSSGVSLAGYARFAVLRAENYHPALLGARYYDAGVGHHRNAPQLIAR